MSPVACVCKKRKVIVSVKFNSLSEITMVTYSYEILMEHRNDHTNQDMYVWQYALDRLAKVTVAGVSL